MNKPADHTSDTGLNNPVAQAYNLGNISIRISPPERGGSCARPDAVTAEEQHMTKPARQYKNRILAALPKVELNRLAPHLTPVILKTRTQLLDGKAEHAYFMEEGLASVVLTLADGATVEVGVIGIEGVVGVPMLLGAATVPGETFIQVAGSGYRIDAQRLKNEFERAGQLRNLIQKYMVAHMVQSAQGAACNRLHSISERLARWILTCHDRVQADRMPLTQEFLGQMLGAPRTTVTLTAGLLHQAGLIEYARGHVTIKDRAGLENVACECYATVRNEFTRLGLL
jgi:CRP-like cAMP-binding protein